MKMDYQTNGFGSLCINNNSVERNNYPLGDLSNLDANTNGN